LSGPEEGTRRIEDWRLKALQALRLKVLHLLYRVAFRLVQLWSILSRRRGRGVKCVLTHRGEVVLVRHTYGPRGVWQLPGGAAHRGEDPAQVAAREMQEELGLRGLRWRELLTTDVRLERVRVNLTCLHAEVPDRVLHPDPVEIAQARWFALDALPRSVGEEVQDLLALLVK
jgi:8-oxo-dGTP pyrophosphatase MutT (NUDIX family)